MDEFVTAFEGVLGTKRASDGTTETLFDRQQLRRLFMKVDANSDGTIDWDEFSSYMLLENQGTSVMRDSETRYEYVEQEFPDACPEAVAHKEPIANLKGPILGDRYLSAGRDGTVKMWNCADLSVHRSLRVGSAWVTDVAYLPRSHKIVVSSFNRSLQLYEVSEKMELVGALNDLEHIPMSLDTWRPEKKGSELLVFGDSGGYIQLLSLTDKPEDDMVNVHDRVGFDTVWKVRPHTDWVTRVRYIADLNAVTSCSLDKLICLTDVERRMPTRTLTGHAKSVYSFDWSRQYKFIASCGMDRNILLWNPFSQKPMASLAGHAASVQDVLINNSGQIISLSVDKQIRVWDVRNHRCIQVLQEKEVYRPENKIGAILYDEHRKCLVTGTLKLKQWPLRAREESGGNAHMHPVSCALFNPDWNEAVSGDFGPVVCVWDVLTGEMRFKFARAHGTAKITSMAFDSMRRRLITGSSNGELKMWNYSNGSCLKELLGNGDAEVTGIRYVQGGYHSQHVVGVGWNRKVTFWEDTDKKTAEVSRQLAGHTEDITSIAMGEHSVLATGGFDGAVILWNIDSGAIKSRLVPPVLARRAAAREGRAAWKAALDVDADCSVEGLCFLHTMSHILVAVYADGYVRLWSSVDGALYHEQALEHAKNENVVTMCVANDDSHIVTADSVGFVKVWALDTAPLKNKAAVAAARSAGLSPVKQLQFWRAHKSAASSVDWVNAEHNREPMILTGGSDCAVFLWTATGVLVGEFGYDRWNVYDKSTWASRASKTVSQQELENPMPDAYIQGPDIDVGRGPDEIAIQMARLPWTHKMSMAREKKAALIPRKDKVFIPKTYRKINHSHVQGRNVTTLAHLLHISDMNQLAPRPKTGQWMASGDSLHTSVEVVTMANGWRNRPNSVPAGLGRSKTGDMAGLNARTRGAGTSSSLR